MVYIRACPKAYHPACIKRDEEFFRSNAKWNCGVLIYMILMIISHKCLLLLYMCIACIYHFVICFGLLDSFLKP